MLTVTYHCFAVGLYNGLHNPPYVCARSCSLYILLCIIDITCPRSAHAQISCAHNRACCLSSFLACSQLSNSLASAVSQTVGQVLQPLMERVEQLESAAAVVPLVNSSSVHALGHPPAARPSLSVHDKLRGRIERGEFIDCDDLLPDQLGVEPDVVQLAVGANRSVQLVQKPTQAQRRHVHDVASWLEAFTVYTRVIVAAAPDRANDLLAYQATILDANNSYQVDAWLSYDRRFRRAIASQPLSYDWAIIDSNLWQSSFTSRGRPPCSRCSLVHPVAQARCPFRPGPPSVGAGSGGPPQSSAPTHLGKPICRNFNKDQCNNSFCYRAHVCLQCRGKHPEVKCGRGQSATSASAP